MSGSRNTDAHQSHRRSAPRVTSVFDRNVDGLVDAKPPAPAELKTGETYDFRAGPVRKRIGDATVKMLAYNGSIPGPLLRTTQDAEVIVEFRNEMDVETTVHWHGLRHENFYDGVPRGPHAGVQAPVPPGGRFSYRLRFPDPGVFWYHPHIREDYQQEHGLYGTIVVAPADPEYWSPANREVALTLDDILMEDGEMAPFLRSGSDHTAMGRFGNVMLTNGETEFAMEARTGEVVRFYVTNTANTRFFNFRIPGARMKLVGGDNGRVEQQEFVDEVLITPSERAVLDVLFEREGRVTMEDGSGVDANVLGVIDVSAPRVNQSFASEFETLRACPDLRAEREKLAEHMERSHDKTVALVAVMPGVSRDAGKSPEVAWEDRMADANRLSTPETIIWKLVDPTTGAENHAIDWEFRLGDRVKIRIVNEMQSDQPMPHPFHIHGERFLVLSRNGVPNRNLVWKDTVLVDAGETMDILMDAANPGIWMAHCHIAEHLEGGMMFSFTVR